MKTRKLLSLILALVMVLSVVSFAGAATFSDVTSDVAPAVSRLVGLGILTGYPDGTFKPGNTITRAEFAAVAVRAMGLEKSADLLANVPSRFSDVKVTDWFNKYVNVATNQGILNGYPDGTFKPGNNITQAEALAIVLRLLGYNDNLPGNWPYNYVTQADRLGLLSDDFTTSAAATRGGVAALVNNALNQNVVTFKDGVFDAGQTPVTFIASVLNGAIEGTLLAPKDVVSTAVSTPTDTMIIAGTPNITVPVAKNVEIVGGAFDKLANHKVIYTLKNGVAVAIHVVSTAVSGKVASKTATLSGQIVKIGNTNVTFPTSFDLSAISVGNNVTAYVYGGFGYAIVPVVAASTGTIDSIAQVNDGGVIKTIITINDIDYVVTDTTTFSLNGASATLADMKAGYSGTFDAVDADADKNLLYFNAWNLTVTGKVDSWTKVGGKYVTITIDGVAYNVADTFTDDVPTGVTATFYVNALNQITGLKSKDTAATTVIGVLDSITASASSGVTKYFVTLKDGVSYDVSAAYNPNPNPVLGVNNLYVDAIRAEDFNDLNVKDAAVLISYSATGAVLRVDVYSPQLVVSDDTGYGASFADITTAKTKITKNGMPVSAVPPTTTTDKYIITWDGVTGKAATIDAITFDGTVVVTGKGIGAKGYYITHAGGTEYFASTAINFYNDIAVGDKIAYALFDATPYYHVDNGKIMYAEVVPAS